MAKRGTYSAFNWDAEKEKITTLEKTPLDQIALWLYVALTETVRAPLAGEDSKVIPIRALAIMDIWAGEIFHRLPFEHYYLDQATQTDS